MGLSICLQVVRRSWLVFNAEKGIFWLEGLADKRRFVVRRNVSDIQYVVNQFSMNNDAICKTVILNVSMTLVNFL